MKLGNRRSVNVVHAMKDVYTTTDEVLRLAIRRSCWVCGHEFVLHDPVSIVITDRGNKPLCSKCFDEALLSEQP